MDDGNHKSIENVKPHVFLGPEAFKKQTNLNKKIIQKKHPKNCIFYIFAFFLGGGLNLGQSGEVSGGGAESRVWKEGLGGGGPRARSGGRVSGGGSPRAGSGGSLSGGGGERLVSFEFWNVISN